MSKYYFKDEEVPEYCQTKESLLQEMKDEGISEMEIIEAKAMIGHDCFFCKAIGEAVTKCDGTCGSDCSDYAPRNKKNGICEYWGYCYEPVGENIKLKLTKK